MARISNRTKQVLKIHRWLITPDSRCIDQKGNFHDKLPNDVAYSDEAKALANLGHLTIEGYRPVAPTVPVVVEAPRTKKRKVPV